MGTHPIFESDFDCLTDMSDRKYGENIEIFVKKGEESSQVGIKLKKELKQISQSDYSFSDPSYRPFTDETKPGELNFDCACVDNLPYGPCGPLWQKYMVQKEVEKLEDSITHETYRKWFTCFSNNASIYMPEFKKDMEKRRREAEAKIKAELADIDQNNQ